jgi:hypothetical protein
MSEFPLLLLLFNRPDLTEILLKSIEEIKISKIYIAIDGPRLTRPEDKTLCQKVQQLAREFAAGRNVEFRIRDSNLGCGPGVKDAIDWFFLNEEAGIILEDDCEPCPDFFGFVSRMLHEFRNDKSIFMVSGDNFLPNGIESVNNFYLTKYTQIWGWGTWRDRWEKYKFHIQEDELSGWESAIDQMCPEKAEQLYWRRELNNLLSKEMPHTWDHQLQFSSWREGCKNICPSANLITNHGLRNDATHTTTFIPKMFKEISKNLVNKHTTSASPQYFLEIDQILFWFHYLQGDASRFQQILIDSDQGFQKYLLKHPEIGGVHNCVRTMADPMLGEVVDLFKRWFNKQVDLLLRNFKKN